MKKILKLLIFIFSILPSSSMVSCLSKHQQIVDDFVNGYFASLLFFNYNNNTYHFSKKISNSTSKGIVYLVTAEEISGKFLKMLNYSSITASDFANQWDYLLNFTAKKLNTPINKKNNSYNFSNFSIITLGQESVMKEKINQNIVTVSWDIDLGYFNSENMSTMLLGFQNVGSFNFCKNDRTIYYY